VKKESCYNCTYFSKKPGIKNYFIYLCSYWGLKSINKLPQKVIYESIGKNCPFYNEKKNLNIKKNDDKNGKNDNLNIII